VWNYSAKILYTVYPNLNRKSHKLKVRRRLPVGRAHAPSVVGIEAWGCERALAALFLLSACGKPFCVVVFCCFLSLQVHDGLLGRYAPPVLVL